MAALSPSSIPASDRSSSEATPASMPASPASAVNPHLLGRSTLLLVLTLIVGLVYWFNPPMTIQPQAGVVMELPPLVGDYYGKLGEASAVELQLLPKDTEFARRSYDDGHGHQINCTIVLSGAEQRSIHRPEGCLTGQGWTIDAQEDVPITLPSGHVLVARNLSLERQEVGQNNEHFTVRAYYLYWFVGQNVTTPSHFHRILLSNWDRVIHNRGHRWAYVSMFSYITQNLEPNGLDPKQTKDLLVNFTSRIVPTFQISEMPQSAGK